VRNWRGKGKKKEKEPAIKRCFCSSEKDPKTGRLAARNPEGGQWDKKEKRGTNRKPKSGTKGVQKKKGM